MGIATGEIDVALDSPIHERFTQLLDEARKIAAGERFFNWQPAFPSVWTDWDVAEWHGGFDAVIGNPPWDRMKLQQVEWFAYRRPEIAHAPRAADRGLMITALRDAGDPLADEFDIASDRAESAVRVARGSGNYPLLSRGDVNIYSLFVERAFALVKPDGVVGLLIPSGIASDKTSAEFFKTVSCSSQDVHRPRTPPIVAFSCRMSPSSMTTITGFRSRRQISDASIPTPGPRPSSGRAEMPI